MKKKTKMVIFLLLLTALSGIVLYFHNIKTGENINSNGTATDIGGFDIDGFQYYGFKNVLGGNIPPDIIGRPSFLKPPGGSNPVKDWESCKDIDSSLDLSRVGILFAVGKDVPIMCTEEIIKTYAEKYLIKEVSDIIHIEGYSCDLGEENYNKSLSRHRAEYVKKILVSAGIPERRIKLDYYGESKFGKVGFGNKEKYRRAQISLMKK